MTRSKISLAVMVAIAAILLFTACSATKRANRYLDKAFKADSATVADRTRKAFPCVVLAHTDTVTAIHDSLIIRTCPTIPAHYDTIQLDGATRDSIIYVPPITMVFRDTVRGATITITQHIEDSAKIFVAQHATAIVQTELDKRNKQYQALRTVLIWLIVALGLAVIVATLLARKKKVDNTLKIV